MSYNTNFNLIYKDDKVVKYRRYNCFSCIWGEDFKTIKRIYVYIPFEKNESWNYCNLSYEQVKSYIEILNKVGYKITLEKDPITLDTKDAKIFSFYPKDESSYKCYVTYFDLDDSISSRNGVMLYCSYIRYLYEEKFSDIITCLLDFKDQFTGVEDYILLHIAEQCSHDASRNTNHTTYPLDVCQDIIKPVSYSERINYINKSNGVAVHNSFKSLGKISSIGEDDPRKLYETKDYKKIKEIFNLEPIINVTIKKKNLRSRTSKRLC